MPLWGKSDASTNAAIFAPSQVNKTPNTNNAAALYNNTTPNAYFSGATVGLYGVSAAEVSATGTSVAEVTITFAGSGYTANAVVTMGEAVGGTNATANASANATGRISAVNIVGAGSGYTSNPSVVIAAPAALTFSGNSTGVVVGNSTSKGFILLGAANVAVLANGDAVTYLVAASNTAIGGLANNTTYYVTVANSTAIQVSSDAEDQVGGVYINLSSVAATAQAGHSLTGQTATATSSLSGGKNKGVLAGWNLRTVGSGGRAGRVQYECLVAMRNIASDGSDDAKLPDA
jgi:hypothetical protein